MRSLLPAERATFNRWAIGVSIFYVSLAFLIVGTIGVTHVLLAGTRASVSALTAHEQPRGASAE
jgi:hypothetical protein